MRILAVELTDMFGYVGTSRVDFDTNFVVLAGPNGCGKTKLLQAIGLAFGQLKDLRDLHCRHASSGRSSVSVEFELAKPHDDEILTNSQRLNDFVVGQRNQGKEVSRFRVSTSFQEGQRQSALQCQFNGKDGWHNTGAKVDENAVRYLDSDWLASIGAEASITAEDPLSKLVRSAHLERRLDVNSNNALLWRELSPYIEEKLESALQPILPGLRVVVAPSMKKSGEYKSGFQDPFSRFFVEDVPASLGTTRGLAFALIGSGLSGTNLGFPGACALLFDEIEVGLHPSALFYVLELLRRLAGNRTIVLTTQSPQVVHYAKLRELYCVTHAKHHIRGAVPVTSSQVERLTRNANRIIEAEFGAIGSASLSHPGTWVLVEGPSDKVYFDDFVIPTSEDPEFSTLGSVRVLQGEGSQVYRYSKFLKDRGCRHVVVLDNDKAGKEQLKVIRGQAGSQVNAELLPWKGTIEDLYDATDLELAVTEVYGAAAPDLIARAKKADLANKGFVAIASASKALGLPLMKLEIALSQGKRKPDANKLLQLRQLVSNLLLPTPT